MHIALIADTHGTLDARIAAAVAGVDLLVHAGDVGNGVEAELTRLAERVVVVRGNNDPPGSGWPDHAEIELPGGVLAVIHGDRWPARTRHRKLRERFPDARAIVCGHSHRRVVEADSAPWILNPGAAGKTRAYGGPGWIALDIAGDHWRCANHTFEPLDTARQRRQA